ncbi:MAG: hypothetical protein EOP88_12595 [Verrucomicrobiaceae bacterium]|nr:MAG: hypothetical protein EOP88_12595 [Verrucomicrobiaceae bacterium]
MTYRRLFLYLLVAGTLLLAGVWWHSFRMSYYLAVARPDHKTVAGEVSGIVHCGTLSFIWNPAGGGYRWVNFDSAPVSTIPPEDRYGPMGRFWFGPLRGENEPPDVRLLQVPLWLVYLLLVGAGLALVWWGERRSAASAEKTLALGDQSGNNTLTP